CISSMWGLSATDNAACYSAGLVGSLMKSQAVARAAGPPTQAVAQKASEPPPLSDSPSAPRQAEERRPAEERRVLQLKGKLAVLDLKNFTKDLTKENAQ